MVPIFQDDDTYNDYYTDPYWDPYYDGQMPNGVPVVPLLPMPLPEEETPYVNTNDTGNTDDKKTPPPPPGPTTQPTPTAQSGGTGGTGGFAWPKFNAPSFEAPPKFQYDAFQKPEFADIFKDPSYQGRRDEGLNAIQNSAAAKGLTRLPQTMKALGGWNQDFASREYGNIFDRAAQSYDRNRANAADTYAMNYGVSRDVFDRGYGRAKDMFDVNQFQPAKLTFEDMYRRYRDNLNSQTTIAAAGAGG